MLTLSTEDLLYFTLFTFLFIDLYSVVTLYESWTLNLCVSSDIVLFILLSRSGELTYTRLIEKH